jgi:protein involved in polysaccharide export with SLBB domain
MNISEAHQYVIKTIARKYNLSYNDTLNVYRAQFGLIFEVNAAMNFEDMTIEEVIAAKKDFNLPAIGKLCVSIKSVETLKNKIKNKSKNDG